MEATITTDGKHIMARIPYANGAGPKWAKLVPGARWHKDSKTWRYPLSMETCRKFRQVFGRNLLIKPALSAWARNEVLRERNLETYREGNIQDPSAYLGRVKILTPALYEAISSRNYQLAGSAFLVEARAALLGDQPGLGKTFQALAALIQHGANRILVSCPRTATRSVWEHETKRWAPHIAAFVCQGSRAERERVYKAFDDMGGWPTGDSCRMLIINTEMIRMVPEVCPYGPLKKCLSGETEEHKHEHNVAEWPFLFEQGWDAVVLDESHNLLASTANIQSKRITQGRYGAMKLRKLVRPNGLVIAMSGTPARSKLDKFWGTLNWLQPKTFGSFWRFAETHFGVIDDTWGKVVGHKNEKGDVVVEPLDQEIWESALRPYYLARNKQAAAPDLPPIQYAGSPPDSHPDGLNGIWVDMTPSQVRSYRDMKDLAAATISGGRVTATGVLAEISRLRQLASSECRAGSNRKLIPAMPSPKIDWVLEFLRERQGHPGKVVIASSFTKMVNLCAWEIAKEFGKDSVRVLTGETSDTERADLVQRFQDPDSPVWVAVINSRAGGEAITLDLADDMIFIDIPWTSDETEQVESRIHRVSRIHNVTVYRLLAKGTVDEWIAGLNDEQRRILQSADIRKLSELAMEAVK